MRRATMKLCVLAVVTAVLAAAAGPAHAQRAAPGQIQRGQYKLRVTPHWFGDNDRFWYRNDLAGGAKEFILVDAIAGTRQPAFDHAKLAAALSKAAGKEFAAERLPFEEIAFVYEGKAVRFGVGDT